MTMKIATHEIHISTQGNTHIINITEDVVEKLDQSNLKEGTVFIFVIGSTAALTMCEYEPGLVADLKNMFEKLVPKGISYEHDTTWGDANGSAHLRASLLGPSLMVPFTKGKLILGTWQQIIFIDFDNRPRERKIIVQFHGE
jgi:secondary thiamine-phosphate synthase enzyme